MRALLLISLSALPLCVPSIATAASEGEVEARGGADAAGETKTERKAAKKAAKKAKKLFKKGSKYLKKKNWDKAIAIFRRAALLAPNVGAIHVNLARALKKADRCSESLLHFQAYLAIKPNAKDRPSINAERKECVVKLGDVARLSVEVQAPDDEDDEDELAPMPSAGGGAAEAATAARDEEEEEEEEEEGEPADPTVMAVTVNGAPVGNTPLAGVILGAGSYTLTVSRAGIEPQTHTITLKAAEGTELLLSIEGKLSPARLAFQIKPDGALVTLQGEPIGAAPNIKDRTLKPGMYVVEVVDPNGGHLPWKGRVNLSSGQEEQLDITLERMTGVIIVRAPPGAAVLVNGEPQRAGRPIEVPEGTYNVRVMMEGRAPWQKMVKVPLGNTIDLIVNPIPLAGGSGGGMDSWRLGAVGAGGLGLLAAIGGGVVGAMASSKYSDVEDRIALGDGEGYATSSEIDDIDGKQFTANLLFGVALVGIVSAAVLWFHDDLGLGGGSAEPTPRAAPPLGLRSRGPLRRSHRSSAGYRWRRPLTQSDCRKTAQLLHRRPFLAAPGSAPCSVIVADLTSPTASRPAAIVGRASAPAASTRRNSLAASKCSSADRERRPKRGVAAT